MKLLTEAGSWEESLRGILRIARSDAKSIKVVDVLYLVESLLELIRGEVINLMRAYHSCLLISGILELRSRLLLPSDEEDVKEVQEEEDESAITQELTSRVKVYQVLSVCAQELRKRLETQCKLLSPMPSHKSPKTVYFNIKDVSLYDLVTAFEDIVARMQKKRVLLLTDEDYPLEQVYDQVLSRISGSISAVNLLDIITMKPSVAWAVSAFLVILELISKDKISFRKSGEIILLEPTRKAA